MPYVTTKCGARPIQLYYEDAGIGHPVILVHGWPLSGRMWEPQIAALVEGGFRVITYDRRGFGASEKPWDGYEYDTLAADLHALMAELHLRDVSLVGFSMGGGEVVRALARFGAKHVKRAVLIGAVPPMLLRSTDNPQGVEEATLRDMMRSVREDRMAFTSGFLRQFFNWDASKTVPSEAQLRHLEHIAWDASPRATEQCIVAFGTTDFRQDLPLIDVPTLVIHGDEDRIVPIEASARRTKAMIRGCDFEVIAGAPHGLTLTHASQINRLLLEYFEC